MIYKPLSVQSDWTDCNSHGTMSVSFRELGTGIQSESSPSVKYVSLKDITREDTEC